MPLSSDWIKLHYHQKPGIVHTETKEIGQIIESICNGIFICEINTTIGKFYRYKVEDLEKAYKILRQLN